MRRVRLGIRPRCRRSGEMRLCERTAPGPPRCRTGAARGQRLYRDAVRRAGTAVLSKDGTCPVVRNTRTKCQTCADMGDLEALPIDVPWKNKIQFDKGAGIRMSLDGERRFLGSRACDSSLAIYVNVGKVLTKSSAFAGENWVLLSCSLVFPTAHSPVNQAVSRSVHLLCTPIIITQPFRLNALQKRVNTSDLFGSGCIHASTN